MFIRSIIAAMAVVVAQALPGHADTIDFAEFAGGFQDTTGLSFSNVDVVSFGDDLFLFEAGTETTGRFCATIGGRCQRARPSASRPGRSPTWPSTCRRWVLGGV